MKKDPDKNQKEVDLYIGSLPEDARIALQHLRETIRAIVPEAEEGFSYGVPAFRIKGKPLVCYAAFKNHCGFYPMSPQVMSRFNHELAGYDTAKGTIRFQPGKPLPETLVHKIVKSRLKEINEK